MNISPLARDFAWHFVKDWLEAHIEKHAYPGYTLAMHTGDGASYACSGGQAVIRPATKMEHYTQYIIGSQTKSLLAAITLLLGKRGVICLDERIADTLAWLADTQSPHLSNITIRDLLNHTSGLHRDVSAAHLDIESGRYPRIDDIQTYIMDAVIEPSRGPLYSNMGYALLGHLLEQKTKSHLHALVQQLLLTPLDIAQEVTPQLTGYSRIIGGARIPYATANLDAYNAAMGYISTATIMARVFHTLLDDTMCYHAYGHELRELRDGIGQHWQPYLDGRRDYQFGIMSFDIDGHTTYGHGGACRGQKSATFYDTLSRMSYSICINSDDAPATDILLSIICTARILLQKTIDPAMSGWNVVLENASSKKRIVAPSRSDIVLADLGLLHPLSHAPRITHSDSAYTLQPASYLQGAAHPIHLQFSGMHIDALSHGGTTYHTHYWPAID